MGRVELGRLLLCLEGVDPIAGKVEAIKVCHLPVRAGEIYTSDTYTHIFCG